MADVVIIGAGPAGIFAAQELAKGSDKLDIVIVEQGKDIIERSRSGRDMLVGWGGAGAYSDGKLTISTDVGGQLSSLLNEGELLAPARRGRRDLHEARVQREGSTRWMPDEAARISATGEARGSHLRADQGAPHRHRELPHHPQRTCGKSSGSTVARDLQRPSRGYPR
ncbi:MAG: FAD-dependent oxidoreductase [Desulfomonilia bacterium]